MGKPQSARTRKTNEKCRLAVTAFAEGQVPSIHAASRHFDVAFDTLRRRVLGGKTHAECREEFQLLSPAEEKVLVSLITRFAASGHPLTQTQIREMAEEIRKRRLHNINDDSIQLVAYDPLGQQWVPRFLARHSQLKSVMGKCIELARVKESSPEVITEWFKVLKQTMDEENISWGNVYNADESGFGIGKKRATRVIVDVNMKEAYQAEPGRQEWVTVMECVCADGNFIPPLIIFKGTNLCREWIASNVPDDWHLSCNTKGWTSNAHGMEWIKKLFEPMTREKANGAKRLLICDGHDSHISSEVIYHCIANDIVLMLLPPHTSHLMQPLDVGVFGPMKYAMSGFLDHLGRTGIAKIQKIEWLECFVKAREKSVRCSNIQGGWRGSGIYPTNSLKVLNKLPPSQDLDSSTVPLLSAIDNITTNLFNITLKEDCIVNSITIHAANTALKTLLINNQPLNTPARKYTKQLTDTVEYLLAENTVLQYEVKVTKDILGKRKTRESGKRMILKGAQVISTMEFFEKIKVCENATKKKKTSTGRPRGRPRKIAHVSSEIIIEEDEDEEQDLE